MRLTAAVLSILAVFALGACGKSNSSSKQDEAKTTVCSAIADIGKQVDTLKGVTISTGTLDQIQTSLKAIDDDLKKISGARNDLTGDNKKQLQDANQQFVSQVQNIASSLVKSTSLSEAKSQAKAALTQLSDAYKNTFAKFSCS